MVQNPLEPLGSNTALNSNNTSLDKATLQAASQITPQIEPQQPPTEQAPPLPTTITAPLNTQKLHRRVAVIISFLVVVLILILVICWALTQRSNVAEIDEKTKEASTQNREDEDKNNEEPSDAPEDAENSESAEPSASSPSNTIPPQTSTTDNNNYLYMTELGVKFKLPAGVTDVAYNYEEMNFNGAFYIESITKNGKIYDVNICGGEDVYRHYSFLLGDIIRWDPNNEHAEWKKSPAVYPNNTKIFEYAGMEYYTNRYGGSGCELGDDLPEYIEAEETVREMINSIEKI